MLIHQACTRASAAAALALHLAARAPRTGVRLLVLAGLLTAPGLAVQTQTSEPGLTGLGFLPGDAEQGASIGTQMEVAIAEGGPGFLAVWTDERTVIASSVATGSLPLGGNQQDVYAQVLDAAGQPLGGPVVVANQGSNQRDPRVAWNGENWLVAFEGQQPDWYFNEHVYAVRVSPTGDVLDRDPLLAIPYEDGQGAFDPYVTSDGHDWLVIAYQALNGQRVVRARRIAPDGSFIDPQPVNLHVSSSLHKPVIDHAQGVYLMAASSLSDGQVHFRLFLTDLTPLSGLQTLGPGLSYQRPAIASNGNRFLVAGRDAHRIEPDGTVLDPAGIPLGGSLDSGYHEVAWTGAHWGVSMRTFGGAADWDVAAQRIGDDGSLLDPEPVLVEDAPDGLDAFQAPTAIGGAGNGDAAVVFVRGDHPAHRPDVRRALLLFGGAIAAPEDLSVGLSRQTFVRTATGDGEHLAVFVSERSGRTRILSQRLAFDGTPIDLEPLVIHSVEKEKTYDPLFQGPEVAWNGSVYLVIWSAGGAVVGKRLSPDNALVDQDPLPIIDDRPGPEGYSVGAVAAAGDVFVVGAFHYVPFTEEPDQWVEHVRVRGSDGLVLDTQPVFVAGGFGREMAGASVGAGALLVWAQYGLHDSTFAVLQGVVVYGDGLDVGPFGLGSGDSTQPDVASEGDRALVAWEVDNGYHDVRGQFVSPDGGVGASFTISAAPHHQLLPSVGFDGHRYVVAWTDFRTLVGPEQLRGDIRAARVDLDGIVLDPDGIRVTRGPLPESLPAVTGTRGYATILFSILNGMDDVKEVQRLGYRVLGTGAVPPVWR